MDSDFELFELNRENLKKIFYKLTKTEKRLNFSDLQKFCIASKIIPVISNQNFINQHQLKALSGKFGNSQVPSKLFLDFPQFEQALKIISIAMPVSISRSLKVSSLFETLSSSLRINFENSKAKVKFDSKRSNSIVSINSEASEAGSCLDLSIKEALETLKTGSESNRVSIPPRPTGRVFSITPSKNNRESNRVKVSFMQTNRSSKVFNVNKGKNLSDLQEFMENEKKIARQVNKNHFNKTFKAESSRRNLNGSKINAKEKELEGRVKEMNEKVEKIKLFGFRIQSMRERSRVAVKLCFKIWALTQRLGF